MHQNANTPPGVDKANHARKPLLKEVSERDKPWDKHRTNTERVARYYKGTEYHKYADRMTYCSLLLDFRLVPDEGELKLKLSASRFCRVPRCPICNWRRSLMWKAKFHKILPTILEAYPKHRFLFLTLTVRNCEIEDLRETLIWMNQSWQRLIQRKAFPAVGWLRSTEVTRGKDGTAHPHFHCLLMVQPGYFSGRDYIKQADWIKFWQSCLRVDYLPSLRVKAIKKEQDLRRALPEVLKYCTKEADLVKSRQWMLTLTDQLYNMKLVSTGGVFKKYLKELENDPADLVGEDNLGETDEGHLFFGWEKEEKHYRQKN